MNIAYNIEIMHNIYTELPWKLLILSTSIFYLTGIFVQSLLCFLVYHIDKPSASLILFQDTISTKPWATIGCFAVNSHQASTPSCHLPCVPSNCWLTTTWVSHSPLPFLAVLIWEMLCIALHPIVMGGSVK